MRRIEQYLNVNEKSFERTLKYYVIVNDHAAIIQDIFKHILESSKKLIYFLNLYE